MTRRQLQNVGLGLLVFALLTGWPQARQQPQSSQERAQDQPFPAGSPFALLPGFKIDRVTPADKTESYIVVTFDSLGRPVVSQSSSGQRQLAARAARQRRRRHLRVARRSIADKLNTCHGLFFEGTHALRRLPRRVRGRRSATADAPAGGRGTGRSAPGDGRPPGARPRRRRGRGNRHSWTLQARGHERRRRDGHDRADSALHAQRHGRSRPACDPPRARRLDRCPDRQQHVRRRDAVNDDAVDKAASPNWNNLKERQFLPQINDPRFGNSTRIGVHAPSGGFSRTRSSRCSTAACATRTTSPTTSPAKRSSFDSDMEWDVNAPWYSRGATAHMIPGGDAGYRNGTGKFQDEYFDTLPALRHLRRGSPVGVEIYQSYAYPPRFFDNLLRGRLVARPPALHGAHAERRDLYRTRGSRRVRSRRADADQRSRSRTRRQHLPDDRRRRRTGWALQGELDRARSPQQPDMTGILAVVRQPQPLSSWGWATIETLKASMGASFAHRAREARARTRRRRRAIAPAPCSRCSGMARPRAPSSADGAGDRSRRQRARGRGLRRRRADQRGRQGGRRRGAQGQRLHSSSGAPPRRSCARV